MESGRCRITCGTTLLSGIKCLGYDLWEWRQNRLRTTDWIHLLGAALKRAVPVAWRASAISSLLPVRPRSHNSTYKLFSNEGELGRDCSRFEGNALRFQGELPRLPIQQLSRTTPALF